MNLGQLAGEVWIFGGNYSNLQATEAFIDLATDHLIPASHVICTGDIVAYCADPTATVQAIRDWGIPVVMGNCEESLGFELDDCGCGFGENTACDLLSKSWYTYSQARISEDARQWMQSLPEKIQFQLGKKRFTVIHGAFSANNRFLFASDKTSEFEQEMASEESDVVIGGHCGIPFAKTLGRRHWLNAGVIGMPANDGQTSTWYMSLKPKGDQIEIRWHSLNYDHQAASDAMTHAGLNLGYHKALLTGLWPSLDVLPDVEKRATGQALRGLEPIML